MSSKLLTQLALLPTRALVQAYTWSTLPFYAAAQRPWLRLRLSKQTGVQTYRDSVGRKVYYRPPQPNHPHPQLGCLTYNQLIPLLDRRKRAFGVRPVEAEYPQVDPHTGEPIKVDGKELKKLKLANEYRWFTVGEVLDRVDSLARGLRARGVTAGSKVILYAENSFEWFCAAVALQRINAVTVTLLSILNDDGILYGINQCDAHFLITSQDLLPKIARISGQIQTSNSGLQLIYIRNRLAPHDDPKLQRTLASLTSAKVFRAPVTTYDQIQAEGARLEPHPFPAINPDDTALIMYTSGTTGNPKGVILSHRNLLTGVHNLIHADRYQRTLFLSAMNPSYLPMAHLYGYLLNMAVFASPGQLGLCSAFTMLDSSPAHVAGQPGDFRLLKPQFLGAVPLVLDRILREVYRKLGERGPLAAPLFTYLMEYKIRWRSRGFDTPIINRLVCRRINQQFGGRLETILTGSAPLNPRTQALVEAALNVRLVQGYGATELTAASHLMTGPDLNYGECGVPFHSAKFYLKDWAEGGYRATDKPNPRGEIVVGGDLVAQGYYRMPAETADSFHVDADGVRWFETGDIGEILPGGLLKLVDRKKDLTKLANGEFVSLGRIESALRASPYVENVCVCTGPSANYVTAVVSPNRRALTELAAQLSKPRNSLSKFEHLCADPEVTEHVRRSLCITGGGLGLNEARELPVRITLVPEEWSQDNGLLTAALKMRRREVMRYYRKQIDRMFATKVTE